MSCVLWFVLGKEKWINQLFLNLPYHSFAITIVRNILYSFNQTFERFLVFVISLFCLQKLQCSLIAKKLFKKIGNHHFCLMKNSHI